MVFSVMEAFLLAQKYLDEMEQVIPAMVCTHTFQHITLESCVLLLV